MKRCLLSPWEDSQLTIKMTRAGADFASILHASYCSSKIFEYVCGFPILCFVLFFFNWRIIALQCYVGICHKQGESALNKQTYTYIHIYVCVCIYIYIYIYPSFLSIPAPSHPLLLLVINPILFQVHKMYQFLMRAIVAFLFL